MLTNKDSIWLEYATYDEDGFVNGVLEDAPDDVKKAYEKNQKNTQEHIDNGTLIPK